MNDMLKENLDGAASVLSEIAGLENQIVAASSLIATALLAGNKLLACGNGGSAAAASHLTTEFVCRFMRDRRPYPAISLLRMAATLLRLATTTPLTMYLVGKFALSESPGTCLPRSRLAARVKMCAEHLLRQKSVA